MLKYFLYIVITWFIISLNFIATTPLSFCSNDAYEHKQYVEIISKEHRLPGPHENFVTYHPPLYYLIGSLVSYPISVNENLHIKSMRLLSSFFGAIALITIFWFLNSLYKEININLLVTIFIATTPKFFFIFNSYTNDSLSTLAGICLIALSYKIRSNWSNKLAILLFFVTVIGVHAKYTVFWCIAIVFIFCFKNLFLRFKLPEKNEIKLFCILVFAVICFLPWAYFHNYKYTKELFPIRHMDQPYVIKTIYIPEHIKTLNSIFNSSIFNLEKFKKPFLYPAGGPYSKINDYVSYSSISSVIGEFEIFKPNIIFVWMILGIHLLMYLISIKEILKSSVNQASLAFILLTHLIQIANIARLKVFCCLGFFLDYRFILWSIVCWSVLYSSAAHKSKYIIAVLFIGIVIQAYFLATVVGNSYGPTPV